MLEPSLHTTPVTHPPFCDNHAPFVLHSDSVDHEMTPRGSFRLPGAPSASEHEPGCVLPPFTDPHTHLEAHLHRIMLCLERFQQLREGEGDAQKGMGNVDAAAKSSLAELQAAIQYMDTLLSAPPPEAAHLPIEILRHRFQLSRLEIWALLTAAAPGLKPELAERIAALLPRDRGPIPILHLLGMVTAFINEREELHNQLGPSATLASWQLLSYGSVDGWPAGSETPTLQRNVFVSPRILNWLRGQTDWDSVSLAHIARLCIPQESSAFRLSNSAGQALRPVLFWETDGCRVPLCVIGAAHLGKASAVTALSARRGLATLQIDVERLLQSAEPEQLLRASFREARLHDAVLLLRRTELLFEAGSALQHTLRSLVLEARKHVWLVLSARRPLPSAFLTACAAEVVIMPWPDADEQVQIWRQQLAQTPCARDLDLAAFVPRYSLTPGDIRNAAAQAMATVNQQKQRPIVELADLVTASRSQLRHRLGDIAELISTSLSWSELVLNSNVLNRVFELIAVGRHSNVVMQKWGFASTLPSGRGISALLSGPPGTGKTTVAMLVAKELSLELFRVDLTRVVSKSLGEIEKNLVRVFEEAENAHAAILFDAADLLFAKCAEVRASNDRFAHLEANDLLQRIESFSGVLLLTTSNDKGIDLAFRRRIRIHITFNEPTEDEREKLWRTLLPANAPRSEDLDVRALASRYQMSGGAIKNAVLRAAFLAAANGRRCIDQDCLEGAAKLEWEDMGRL